MASFRGIKIEDNVIKRDDSVTEEVWFEENTLQEVTEIGDSCFGLKQAETWQQNSYDFRPHHASTGPSVLDLSAFVSCKKIGDYFAVGHYGPIILPPALESAGDHFLAGMKCRVLELPVSLESLAYSSFFFAVADRIIFSKRMTDIGHNCFERARIATLEIPGSVEFIEADFCKNATIGTLTFARNNVDEHGSVIVESFLHNASIQTLDLKRSVQWVEQGSALGASATISVLRHLLPTPTTDPPTPMSDPTTDSRAVLLANLPDAPHEKATPEDPEVSRAAPQPPLAADSDIDLAALEVFEDKHRSFVQHGDTIDMSGLVKCLTLGPKCFAGLTGVSKICLPLQLSTVSEGFLENASVPELDIVFPLSLRDVEDGFLRNATVRSVDFGACGGLFTLGCCLMETTITKFTFPPNLQKIQTSFMQGINAPHLKVEFPKTVHTFVGRILDSAKLRSVDFSKLGERGWGEGRFLECAIVEEIVFPRVLRELSGSFLTHVNSPRLDLVFPPSLEQIPRLSGATVRSVDCGQCRDVQMIDGLQGATLESYVFPPNATTINSWFMSGVKAPDLNIVFPSSLSTVDGYLLSGATVRSVNFSKCGALRSIGQECLRSATVASALLPPKLRVLEENALKGIRGQDLAITFPESLQEIKDGALVESTVKSIDMSAAESVTRIPTGFCCSATVSETVTLPPAVTSLGHGAFSDFTCAEFRFDASPSLQLIGPDVFRGANIATVTVTDSPKLKSVGDNFLRDATLDTPASLVFTERMTSIGKSFCAGTTLQRLELHVCDKITTLPEKFLFETDCSRRNETEGTSEACVRLPSKVSTYGDRCFASSKGITSVPAKQSALTVGNSFGADSDIAEIPWAGYWVTVGNGFCKGVKALKIDDAACFYSVGDDFCRNVGKLTVDFSRFAVKEIGTGFLQEATFSPETTAVDLSHCSFEKCPERFMYQACFERVGGKVTLPSTVSLIGTKCCAKVTQLEELSVASSSTGVPPTLTIQHDFLRGCASSHFVALPSTVTSFGDRCFQDCRVLTVSLSLPLVKQIGSDFCATDESTVSGELPGVLKDPGIPRINVSLKNVHPQVQIGGNFLAHADCASLEFGMVGCVAVETDQLVADLEAALLAAHGFSGTSDGAVALKELIALRKVTIAKMTTAISVFRSITAELSATEARKDTRGDDDDDASDRTKRLEALLKELQVEEQIFFRHQHPEAREALQRQDYNALLKVMEEMDHLVDQECMRDPSSQRQNTIATSSESSRLTIGDNFLTGATGLTKLDMSRAAHAAIGDRFAANSTLREVHLPPTVTVIGTGLCDGCRATVTAAPQSQSTSECYLSSWMEIHSEKERIDTLVHFRELLPTTEQYNMARWLLEQKRFAEFKGAFDIRDGAVNLRYVGGTVDDLPDVPDDVPAWLGFDFYVFSEDSGLSLLHWAVKYSRQFPHLLSEVSWSLRDLTLVTEQGFTALHYAVLYDIEAAALGTLLSIAAKAEIHRTWSDAWGAGGVRLSPLHLAYVYRRDGIVKELLAFEWDPTETIKLSCALNDADGTRFDAFDQSVMELGHARAAAALQNTDDQGCSDSRASVPVQLSRAAILLCLCNALESGIHRGHTTDQGIRRAFVTLRSRLSTDFQLLSPNKRAEAWDRQLALAKWGSGKPNAYNERSFASQEEFLQEAFASALSDSAHGPNVRLQYCQLLSTTTSLKAFVVSQPSHAALKITAETLLLRTRSMEEGPHRDKVRDKLAVVIPFRFVIPVLPFFYLTLMTVFGLSWFFHPPILEPTLMGIENAIADCTNPYNTKDATEDGVIPWNCSVGFTELGMQVEAFGKQTEAAPRMASFFSFIEKDKIPRNVTHLPWAYLRFATIVTYNGLKTKADSVADAETTPAHTAQKYWVLTELRKPPEWVPEIFEQKNTKANESTISFKGETTRTFAHTVVPYQFGNQTLLGAWMAGVAALLLACVVAFVYHGYNFYGIVTEREVRLVAVTTVQRSLRSVLLACEFAAVLFIAVGLVIMATTFHQHKADDLISRATAAQWQRGEIFFRVGLTFCSFRAVSFFSEMPKPHHFAMVNAGAVGLGLIAALVSLLLFPASRVSVLASLKSLLSIQAVDALTLPVVLAVSLFFRSSKVTDEVRQAHYDNLRDDIGDESGRARRMDAAGRETASCCGVEGLKNNATAEHQITRDVTPPDAESSRAPDAELLGNNVLEDNATVAEQQPAEPVRAEDKLQGGRRLSGVGDVGDVTPGGDESGDGEEGDARVRAPVGPELRGTSATRIRGPGIDETQEHSSQGGRDSVDQEAAAGAGPAQVALAEGVAGVPRSSTTVSIPNTDEHVPAASEHSVSNAAAGTNGVGDAEELPPSAPPPASEHSVPEGTARSASTAGSAAESSNTEAGKNDGKEEVLAKARRRWALSWAVILVAGLGQVLLYGLAVTVVVRPLLTLPAPGGVLPVTGDSFLSSDDLGMVGFARRFFF